MYRLESGVQRLKSIGYEEGRIMVTGHNDWGMAEEFIDTWHVTDHLGNVRAVVDITDIQRWTTPDPLAEKYYDLSPYAFCANNPINFVDPDGMDWYEDDAGNAMWIDCSTEVHVDSTGREWKNIGPEYLFFNGQYLFTSDNLRFISMRLYLEDLMRTGILYTQEIQSYWKTNPINVILAPIHKGKFPGGSFAWGYYRVWIENPDIVNVYNYESKTLITRSGFSINGGITPGSAGCIDLYKNANRFF